MNLALLRVCAAVMIMNSLYNIASLLFNRFYAEMTGDIEPLGFFIASLLLCVIIFALGTVALVKQNVLVLKIYAVWIAICILGGTVVDIMNFNRLPLGVSYSHLFNSLLERIVNPMIVFVVAVFFIEPKKATQFGLLQFCTAFFMVDGANDMIQSIVSLFKGAESFSIVNAVLALLPIALGVFAIVKRNSLILKIYAVIAFVELLWGSLGYMRENMYGGYYVASAFVGLMFNTFLVVCVATFFIEPEKTRAYFQKVKSLFVKWKEMT
ncbi:hypothetical protein [Fibrobacter sp. UBA4297]|uniref:hypothetical protein n=1 Tax=Fibrobacter sp. UBA4297 TaxID=1946536 RepID=UPI0025BE7F24|nr:hypothetical protein [Fibrobacter sp. UBA4297]